MEGKTLFMTDLGKEMLACMLLCCRDWPARILPLFVAGKAAELKGWGLSVKNHKIVLSEES